jgi:hypothetical protein
MEGSNVSVLPTARCQLRLGKAIRPVLVLADTADLIHSSAAKRSGEAGANRWMWKTGPTSLSLQELVVEVAKRERVEDQAIGLLF